MRFHQDFVKPLCRPPVSAKGTLTYLQQKYTNYYIVYGLGAGIFPVILISLFFGKAHLIRSLATIIMYFLITLLIWKKKYKFMTTLMMFSCFLTTLTYWRSPEHFDAYQAPFTGLISMSTFGCSKKGIAFYSICTLVVTWVIVKENMSEFVRTAPREQLEIAIQKSLLGMLRAFGSVSLQIITRTRMQETFYAKWILLRKKIQDQNEQLQKSNVNLNKALEEKETFILSFSHETRNPLNGLLGNLHRLSDMTLLPEAAQVLKKALVCSKILKNILLTILDSGRTGQSPSEIVLVPVSTDMRIFIDEVWILSKDLISAKGLQPVIAILPGIPARLMIDPERTTQVIFNLISNAIKFTDKGFIKLSISWRPDNEAPAEEAMYGFFTAINTQLTREIMEGKKGLLDDKSFKKFSSKETGTLRITVLDTGCGIKEADQKIIFEKFAQIDSNYQLKKLGLGLGLWISKVIVNSHKGDISLKSKEDHGSSFTATFPTTTGTNLSCLDQECMSPSGKKTSRALVVEDFPINQIINAEMLKKYGIHETTIVSNGEQAVQVFQEKGPAYFDVITMDLEMPVMKGKEAITKIREWEALKQYPKVKIAIISGNAVEKEIQECLNPLGKIRADAFLEKPCDFLKFSRTMRSINVGGDTLKRGPIKHAKKVLFADDDFFNLDILTNFAKQLEIEYFAARNGKEAVDIFEKNFKSIDLVFLDNEMPVMSGNEACKVISERIKIERIKCQIYLVSGAALNKGCEEASRFDGIIQKPFTFERFQSVMQSMK